MIGDATLVITREQLVAIVQLWWERYASGSANAPMSMASTHVRDVAFVGREGAMELPADVRIYLSPNDAAG